MNKDDKQNNFTNDPFLDERIRNMRQTPPPPPPPGFNGYGPGHYPYANNVSKKSKFVAGLFAFFFPGLGHFYLGLMQRGLSFMLLLALDIMAIVYFSSSGLEVNIPLIVLLSLLIPGIYFYNLFDALQCTDRINVRRMYGYIPDEFGGASPTWDKAIGSSFLKGNGLGLLLIMFGVFVILFSINPGWLRALFQYGGSYLAAIILIVVGGAILFRESKKNKPPGQ